MYCGSPAAAAAASRARTAAEMASRSARSSAPALAAACAASGTEGGIVQEDKVVGERQVRWRESLSDNQACPQLPRCLFLIPAYQGGGGWVTQPTDLEFPHAHPHPRPTHGPPPLSAPEQRQRSILLAADTERTLAAASRRRAPQRCGTCCRCRTRAATSRGRVWRCRWLGLAPGERWRVEKEAQGRACGGGGSASSASS